MKKSLIAGLALAAVLGLSACGTPATISDKPSAPKSAVAKAKAEPTKAVPTAEPESDGVAKFGQTFTWNDGVAITVTPVKAAQASEYAAGADKTGGQIYIFSVEINNGSKKTFDPALFGADVNYGADGTAASRVFDTASGLGDSFQGKILAGKKQKVEVAFAIPTAELGDVQMTVSPNFSYTDQIFAGALK